MSDNESVLDLSSPKFNDFNQLSFVKSHVLEKYSFEPVKLFTLDVELSAVPGKMNSDKLIAIKKIFYQIDGFKGVLTPSKFPEIIKASFISEFSMNKTKELAILDLLKSAVESIFSKFEKIVSIKIQLIVKFELSEIADLVAARWSVFMEKNSVHVTKAIDDKQLWISRDLHQALLYTLLVGTTAHDLSDLLESYGGKTCLLAVIPVHMCVIDASKLAVIGSTLVFKSVNLCWAGLLLAHCAYCKQFGHIFTGCLLDKNSGVHSKQVVTPQDQVYLANIYKKKQVPIVHPVSFIAGSAFSYVILSDFLGTGSFLDAKPVSLVSIFLGDFCLLLMNQVSVIMKKLSFVKLVPLAFKSHVSSLVVLAPVTSNLDLKMALDNILVSSPPSLLVVVTDSVANFTLSSSKVLTIKVGRLESKMMALEVSVGSVLKRLDCLCFGLGINVPAKQEDIICWHRDFENLVLIITEMKLRSGNRSWIRDKFNEVRVFLSGLDKSFLGTEVVIIMNTFLAHYVCKIFEVLGQLFLVKLLFKNKLSVLILGLYAGTSLACLDLGLVNSLGRSFYVKTPTWANSWDMVKTIDFLFISSNLVNAVVNYEVSNVSEFFDTDYWAVFMLVSLGGLLDNIFKGATSANAVMFLNEFVTSVRFSDLDNFDDVFTKKSSKFYKLELLVSRIDIVNSGARFNCVHSVFFGARKFYCTAKLVNSLKAKKANIRSAINRRMENFKINKGHMIRNVLECPFRKVVLDYLVVDNELILEPNLVKSKMDVIIESWTRKCGVVDDISDEWHCQYQPLEYVFNETFSGIMDSIKFNKLVGVVSVLSDSKAAGLLVLDMFLVLLNSCLSSESVSSSWKEAWILSKILSKRISVTYSTFDVLHGDNFLVLKSTSIQSSIFAIGLVIKNALKKNQELWLVLQNILVRIKMCSKFICFFGGIQRDHTNRIITDFGLTSGYHVHECLDQKEHIFYNPLLCEVKRQKSVYKYRLNFHFISKSSCTKTQTGLFSFFAAGTFTVAILINSKASNFSLSISESLISIAKKGEFYQYLSIFLSTESFSRPSLAKINSDICFFTNLVLRKAISDKQLLYLVLVILHPIVSYRTQFSFVFIDMCNKWNALIHKSLKLKSGLLLNFPSNTIHHPSFYVLLSVCVSASNNFLTDMVHIFLDCNLSLDFSSFFFLSINMVWLLWINFGIKKLDFHGPVPNWFKISVAFLNSLAPFFTHLLDSSGIGHQSILGSDNFASICNHLFWVNSGSLFVYMDGFLKNLDTVGYKAGIAAFFEDINLGLGVGVSDLMLSTMAELQAIVLALKYVPMFNSVYLFLDSQSALDACKLELGLVCPDFHNKCWSYSGISGNEHADMIAKAVSLFGWCLSSCLDECFIVADGSVISGNSKYFVHDIYCSVCHAHWEVGFGSKFLMGSLIFEKCLYNRLYFGVLCLYCGDIEMPDHVFSCRIDRSVRHWILESHLLSSCGSDFPVFIALYKGFIFSGWYHEAVSIFHDSKIAGLKVVKFVYSFAYIEKNGLIFLDSLAIISVSGLASRFSAEVVKLLGVTNAFGIQFGFCKLCLFFSGIGNSVLVYIAV
ncbi:hypothetical protein G9A89_019253 [Geosiphon pyriformis]|nr:hypothetical protein G9A89_019253 [Geosiphon pyriformis]